MPLFGRFPPALSAAYSDLKQRAFEQSSLLIGTPGTVSERVQDGRSYFYRQFYDAEGAKGAEHIGPVDDPDSIRRAAEMREQVVVARELLAQAQLLARSGYIRADANTDAVLVACANGGLFRGGAVLIGSHAFGALLNDLAARIAAFTTDDIDIARRERLELAKATTFESVLISSRIPFRAIPSLDRKGHPTSYRRRAEKGKAQVRVDLVAPAPGGEVVTVAAPELDAHATGLPYLRYLLGDPVETIVIGRSAVIPVNAPQPSRMTWHKMLVSQLRASTSDKANKDLDQASTLLAALTEVDPEELLEARRKIPTSALGKVKRAAARVDERLRAAGHENAAALLADALGTR